jgi:NAD(P)H-dependent FMN reductase
MTTVKLLVLVGIRAPSLNRAVAALEAESSSDMVTVNVFDSIDRLPPYSETLEYRRTPDAVVALRTAVIDANAVLVVTNYNGRVPAMVHNAIDWLTRRWNQGALHDKPLAVIGCSAGCYSGVWSHNPVDAAGGISRHRVVEPITVATLHEAVRKLAGEVHGRSAPAASERSMKIREL